MSSTTTFEPALDVKNIKAHPANPRRKAIADDEMVASIKGQGLIQPIVVAPAADGEGYVVIAGHRRLDGMKKARKKTAPAIVRTDLTTDAQQIEAAVVENVHRVDLSPMEEAEAFEQLRELKHTQRDISKMTGRPVATIRDRLKLLKLSKKTRDSVHTGQLTIGDALQIVAFDDDPKAQAALVKAAGTSGFRLEVEKQQRLRQNRTKVAATVERLTKDGVREYDMKGARDIWTAQRENEELRRLSSYEEFTYDEVAKQHDGCLGYVISNEWDGTKTVALVCTASSVHKEKLTKAQREAEQAVAERQAHWDREREAAKTQARLRRDSVLELIPEGAFIPDPIVDALRALMPGAVDFMLANCEDGYFDALDVKQDDRVKFGWNRADVDDAKAIALADSFNSMPGWRLMRALLTILVEFNENSHPDDAVQATFVLRYMTLLAQLGHDFTEHDAEIRDRAKGVLDEAEAEAEAGDEPAEAAS